MALLTAPPEGWATPALGLSSKRFEARSQAAPVQVVDSWEGLVESREGDLVYARLVKRDRQLPMRFSLNTFTLGGPIEVGSTFEARSIVDQWGNKRWENVPHPPVEIPVGLIEEWQNEVAHFADSGL